MNYAKLGTALCILAIAGLSGYSGYRLGMDSQHQASALPLNTQFVQAATRGDLNEMERLHKLGADVNGTQDPSGGFTALDRASDLTEPIRRAESTTASSPSQQLTIVCRRLARS